jgi:hypothetical protein
MKTIENVKVNGFGGVRNQFTVRTPEGLYFQSYQSIIAFKPNNGDKITLDKETWNYSVTTGKYRNQFLRETKKETEKKIKSGEYILANLN